MKQDQLKKAPAKPNAPPSLICAGGNSSQQQQQAKSCPEPAPTWTRYTDSRLKQFGTR
jgi:hypothetical protein